MASACCSYPLIENEVIHNGGAESVSALSSVNRSRPSEEAHQILFSPTAISIICAVTLFRLLKLKTRKPVDVRMSLSSPWYVPAHILPLSSSAVDNTQDDESPSLLPKCWTL